MKTKEELDEIKKEVEELDKKLNELTDEELNEVTGGVGKLIIASRMVAIKKEILLQDIVETEGRCVSHQALAKLFK